MRKKDNSKEVLVYFLNIINESGLEKSFIIRYYEIINYSSKMARK